MARSRRNHCVRCECDVEVEYQHSPRLRKWLKAYFIIPMMLLPMLPFLAGDFAVSLPLMMAYMLGIGPALSIVREPPTCKTCGALIPAPAPARA